MLAVPPALAALLVFAGCAESEREHTDRAAESIAPAGASGLRGGGATKAAPQDTAPFAGTTAAIHKPRSAPPVYVLREVRAAEQAGYDRVTFEFAGDSVPGYDVEYMERPARECGSGNPVTVAGAGRLLVRLEPAQAHDERGSATIAERRRAPALPAIREMHLVCDFEGQVEWVLGVAARAPYRVLELTGPPGPPRIVLDVRHQP